MASGSGGLRGQLAQWLFGDYIESRVSEASLASEDRGWRSVSGGTREVGFSEIVEQIRDSTEAYRANPLAFRIVELTTDYVLGKGVKLACDDPEAQAWLNAWWAHPQNRMETRQYELCTELSLTGDLFVTLHRNPYDGMCYLRPIPGLLVDQIEVDPEDAERELRYHQQATATLTDGLSASEGRQLVEGRWWEAGECRHYAVNRVVGTVRGQGDLVPLLPWLRRYKDWLTDRVRMNKYRTAFVWDVLLRGADQRRVSQRRAELMQPPSPGSVIVHNESEEWQAKQPNIDAKSVESDGKAMRLMVAAGAGLPLHFLAEGESATRATAAEMGGPTLRHFERRQRYFGWVLCDLASEALRRSGRFAGRSLTVRAQFEDLTTRDNLAQAQAARSMMEALGLARDRGWIEDAAARVMVERFLELAEGVKGGE